MWVMILKMGVEEKSKGNFGKIFAKLYKLKTCTMRKVCVFCLFFSLSKLEV